MATDFATFLVDHAVNSCSILVGGSSIKVNYQLPMKLYHLSLATRRSRAEVLLLPDPGIRVLLPLLPLLQGGASSRL
jgi:hypothetical protein